MYVWEADFHGAWLHPALCTQDSSCLTPPTGEWRDGARHGLGMCSYPDGACFRGRWEVDGWVQGPADARTTRVHGPGLSCCAAGRPGRFVIEARDAARNPRLSGGDEFVVALRGPTVVYGAVRDCGDGRYEAEYVCGTAGRYSLAITLPGSQELVAGAPFKVRGEQDGPNTLDKGEGGVLRV